MKTKLCLTIVVLTIAAPMLHASHTQTSETPFVQGTVVSVQKQDAASPAHALTTPTDAPLSSRYYTYEVTVRVGCKIYVGRYKTAFDYLPSAFSRDQRIPVRLTRHVLYFHVPNDAEMRMGIVHRATESATDCSPSHPSTT